MDRVGPGSRRVSVPNTARRTGALRWIGALSAAQRTQDQALVNCVRDDADFRLRAAEPSNLIVDN